MIIAKQLLFMIPLVGRLYCAGMVSSLAVPMDDNTLGCYLVAVMEVLKKPDRLVAP